MGPDVLRRIRWGNVGRLAGALAVLAAVAAWPRLAPPGPALPGEVARPLDGLPAPTATPPAELLGPRPPRGLRRPAGRARRSRATAKRDGPREAWSDEPRGRRARKARGENRREDGRTGLGRGGRVRGTKPAPGRAKAGEGGGSAEPERGGEEGGGRSGGGAQPDRGADEDGGRSGGGAQPDRGGAEAGKDGGSGETGGGADPVQTEFGFERG